MTEKVQAVRETLVHLARQLDILPRAKQYELVRSARATATVDCAGEIPRDIEKTLEAMEAKSGIWN